MIVLGSASMFGLTSDHLFWQWEMTFILAIFELGEFFSHTEHLSEGINADVEHQ